MNGTLLIALCINVVPKRVVIDEEEFILKQLKKETGKIVYMVNSASGIMEYHYPKLLKIFDEKEIAISMSDGAALKHLKNYPLEYERLKDTHKWIVSKNTLPVDIKILITTSRLKEGINIKDTAVETVICESHIAADIIQFAGRVRHGVDNLYIVDNAIPNSIDYLLEIDYEFSKSYFVETCNKFVEEHDIDEDDNLMQELFDYIYSKAMKNKVIGEFIRFVEKTRGFQYTRYNHINNKFDLYELRHAAVNQINRDKDEYLKDAGMFIKNIFNNSNIKIEDKAKKRRLKKEKAKQVIKRDILLILERYTNKEIYEKDKKQILLEDICTGVGIPQAKQFKIINKALENKGFPYFIDSVKCRNGEYRDKRFYIVRKKS